MRQFSINVIVLALVAFLSGCAGKDFVRPEADSLKNGQTAYANIIANYGTPFREGSVLKNDKTLKTLSYAYASVGGKPLEEGVTASRALGLYFYNDILVGHEFISSWAEDHTNFDETKIKDIVKGKTTRQELTQLLGRPSGYYIYPLTKAPSGEAPVFAYSATRGSAFNLKFFRKILVVTLDSSGVVSDVDFSSSGTK